MLRAHRFTLALFTLFAAPGTTLAVPLSTAFTYQAAFEQQGSPLEGSSDFQFALFDLPDKGVIVGAPLTIENVAVENGVVSIALDFGVDVFDGDARWLEVSIRSPHDPDDLTPYTTLSPRQTITAIPYALQSRGIFVDADGNVSIGTTIGQPFGPSAKFDVLAETIGAPAIKGRSTSTTGTGVVGEAPAAGIRGDATASTGSASGVHGTSMSTDGDGVFGHAMATTGAAHGVTGLSDSADGAGIMGHATSKTGSASGVTGMSESPDGAGVVGHAMAKTGAANGVMGTSESVDGVGVMGHATALGGETSGIHGMSDSPEGTGVIGEADAEGVRGLANATTGTARGVCGISESTTGEGVLGHATADNGSATGVHGMSDSMDGSGVLGEAPGEGVRGEATATSGEARGVCGVSPSTEGEGIRGEATAGTGTTYGVRGVVNSPAGYAGYFEGRGYFSGDVGIGTTDPTATLHVDRVFPASTTIGGAATRISFLDQQPDLSGTTYGLDVNSGTKTTRGSQIAVEGSTAIDVTGQRGTALARLAVTEDDAVGTALGHLAVTEGDATGAALGRLALTSGFVGNGTIISAHGVSTVNGLSNFGAGNTSFGVGGLFNAAPTSGSTLLLNGTGTYFVGGVYATVGGTNQPINSSSNSIVAAVIGRDLNPGTAPTYGGYFEGRGYFSENVGIGTTNPTARLHIGGTPGVDGIRFPDGTLQTTAGGGGGPGNTLDQAYDQGGPGAGRTITADAGAVNIAGSDGLTVSGDVEAIRGVATHATAPGIGVHGLSLSQTKTGAGVRAVGNGAGPPGQPRAAALSIDNGAITVNKVGPMHPTSPAGTIELLGSVWSPIQSCDGGEPPHPHKIGHYTEFDLENDLIVDDSIILTTVEVEIEPPSVNGSFFAQVMASPLNGHRIIRVTFMGDPGPACTSLPGQTTLKVHYLIINPVPLS